MVEEVIEVTAVYQDGINTTWAALDAKRLAHESNISYCANPLHEDIRTHQIPIRPDEDPYYAFMKAVPKMKIAEVAMAQTFYIVNPLGRPVRTFTARVIIRK